MHVFFYLGSALAICTVPLSAFAQTEREIAVAIDRVKIPRSDKFELEIVAKNLHLPWSMAFLPKGGILVVEKHRGLKSIGTDQSKAYLVDGMPANVFTKEDSGYLDIVLDPEFRQNKIIYMAFVEGVEAANRTAIWKARFEEGRLKDGRVIFRTNVSKKGPSHPGGRLLFLPDKTLLLTVGDGFDLKDQAQNMSSHLGKILRLTREGKPAPGNPFLGNGKVASEIWSSGHRNIQGLSRDSKSGEIWAHEHGPRGGDEINLIKPSANYGWPIVTHGIDYDGTIIAKEAFKDGIESAKFYWTPSIAPSGLTVYHGDRYSEWNGKFFVGALASRALVRLRRGRKTGLMVEEERMFSSLRARIRDVRTGPDGYIYILTDDKKGELFRIVQKNSG